MNAQPNFTARHPVQTVATAAVAAIVALSLLWGVAALFQSRGAPLDRLAAAERACADRIYQSERQACVHQWLDDLRPLKVAAH